MSLLRRVLAAAFVALSMGWTAVAQEKRYGASVVPESFLRGYDPVTVRYAESVGPSDKAVPADGPGEWLGIEPALPGEYRWLDRHTIQFLPAVPWPPLSRFGVEYKGGSRSLLTMMSAPSSIEPRQGSADLEPIDGFTLVFPSRIDPEALARMIRIEIRDLPGVDSSGARWLASPSLSVRELPAPRQKGAVAYRVALSEKVPYGKKAILHLRLSLDETMRDSIAAYSFSTKADFRLSAMGARSARLPAAPNGSAYAKDQAIDCGIGSSPLYLEFSESIQAPSVEELKRLVRFEPAVRNLRHSVSGNLLMLEFDADRDKPYKASVSWQPLRSATGRELARFSPSSFFFYFRQAEPFLSWKASRAILERYGPQFLPLEGRGTGRVDLRIHKIDPESRDFWPFPSSPITIAEDSRPPMPGEEPPYGSDIAKHIRLLGSPTVSTLIDLPIGATSARSSFGLDIGAELSAAFGASEPGHYIVGIRSIDARDRRSYARVTVTDLCLSSVEEEDAVVFLVTSLRTGAPVSGARIRIDGFLEGELSPLVSGATDQSGRFRYVHREALPSLPARVLASKDGDVVVFDPRDPPPSFANNHWSSEGSGWLEWLVYEPRDMRHDARSKACILTDRPVYRPEEEVHILGWARDRKDGEIIRYDGDELEVLVRYEAGDEWTFPAPLSGLGRFYLRFAESDPPTGWYDAELRVKKTGSVLATASFSKESYRVPTFKVDISGPDRVPVDKAFELELVADYYAGGRVVGESVRWDVSQYPYSVSSPAFPGYVFSTDVRFGGGGEFGEAETREAVLDEEGSARIAINPAAELDGRARRYVVEATVMGADRQTVTQAKQVLALPSFCIGLKVDRFVAGGEGIRAGLVALDYAERPLAGLDVGIRLYQRQWHSYIAETDFTTGEARYVTDIVDTLVAERSATTTDGELDLSFPAGEAGVYILEAWAPDALGRRVTVKADFFLQGGESVSWERKKSGLFEASPDKASYQPGDKARLLLKSPYEDGWALIVVEAPEANEYHFVRVSGGAAIQEIPIRASMAPGIPVAVLLERGRVVGTENLAPGAKADLGKPASLGASAWLKVQPTANQARLGLSHASKAQPATPLTVEMSLADSKGVPLDGEIALWLVDKAVLSLGSEASIDILPSFIDQTESYVRIRDARNLIRGALPVEEVPGGDGMLDELAMMELMNRTTVRKNFRTVPYFNPSIKVVRGRATVSIDLPDNLTDFAIRAVAVSGYGKMGFAKSSVSVRLPVLVQSVMPRFARPGDSFTAGALARVVEGPGGPGKAVLDVEGISIDGAPSGSSGRELLLDQKLAEPIMFDLRAPLSLDPSAGAAASVALYVQRDSDGARDAFSLDLPIRDDVRSVRIASLDALDAAAPLLLREPAEGSRPGGRDRSIVVARDPRLLKILLGLEYLAAYPHGCLEQRISRAMPAIELSVLLDAAGLKDRRDPKADVAEIIEYMRGCQDSDGLFSFWPGSTGSVSLSAYVLEFLGSVADAGMPVDEEMADAAVAALERALRSDYERLVPAYATYERVEALVALERAGRFDAAYASELLAVSAGMSAYSQARLYSLLSRRSRANGPKERELLSRLISMVVTRKEGERVIFDSLQDKSAHWGGPVLSSQTKTLAALAEAIGRGDSKSKLPGILVDELVSMAGHDGWGSTQDNVAALRALTSLIAPESNKGDDVVIEWRAGGTTGRLSTKGASIASFTIPADKAVSLQLKAGAKGGAAVWVLSRLDYRPAPRGSETAAENAGFAVEREFLRVESGGDLVPARPDGRRLSFALEELVEEHVRVVNFEDRDYVAVSVPLAAGFEPLNPSLATSPKEAHPSGELTLEPSYAMYLDDVVRFYYDSLPKGTYDFYFRSRASFSGSFTAPSAAVELMYELDVRGRSEGREILVAE